MLATELLYIQVTKEYVFLKYPSFKHFPVEMSPQQNSWDKY